MVTPSDLSLSETSRLLLSISTAVMLAVARSWCPAPRMTTSDLSAVSCRPLCKNHSRTADEQTARRSRVGVVSLVFIAMNTCVHVVCELVVGHTM